MSRSTESIITPGMTGFVIDAKEPRDYLDSQWLTMHAMGSTEWQKTLFHRTATMLHQGAKDYENHKPALPRIGKSGKNDSVLCMM
ncbi:MAG: hypothetical protein PHG65_06895 [Kiritimatiellae bacterium]|nr:hypothetical protein [Kiritimatiellia bacterium]